MSIIKNRIIQYLDFKGVPKSDFYKMTGASNGVLSQKSGISEDNILRFLNSYRDVSVEWLITGEGDMIRNEKDSSHYKVAPLGKSIPLLPVNASGGYLDDFVAQVTDADCETMLSPIHDVDFGITVVGNSMEPLYPNGSKILIKKINEKAFIEWGKVFVLDTTNGIVVKQLKPSKKDGVITCVSFNENYPAFDVSMEDIFGIYKVMMVMSMV
ncbi:hypothetical protein K5X82_07275 [Halosquirtibacter xylanolyticus]|uniref:S24 family peptidase n=1 Tax=Halosquirtibacter xylanolyticus TaxID=3374599 RepID=UPI003748EE0C|nr:hypothetical protein K5X82_07275 [Prolixibacteraceae bacterium]